MTTIQDQRNYIAERIADTEDEHLADCLDQVPDANIVALCDMIQHKRANAVPRSVTNRQIVQDVAEIISGHPENIKYSKPFLKD